MKIIVSGLALLVSLAMVGVGCKSQHEPGVKSNYMSQWTMVARNTQDTTDAAKAVLEDEGLKGVVANSTMVDGKASGTKADGTKVVVDVEKAKEGEGSQVSVKVGSMGDPALGAEIARKIKMRAEK